MLEHVGQRALPLLRRTFEYTRNRIAISGYDSNGAGSWNITQAAVNPDGDKVTVNGRGYDATKITC